MRKKYNKLTQTESVKRNSLMFKKFKKLLATGKYGRMKLYEMLGDEFDISERNSVGGIIRSMENKEKSQTVKS
ncbi:hypothetical protein EG346_17100 [Chryseobacterium carnipullorum]|uniref:Uncharacterized protein n=1 Tax=Chryseobacterium carnipullorum TaxID=1124835 RepID=A0A376DUA9_CHRCU|nr:hypothetical protein [Chryseobacterium carnipullorum]AZA49791.1 hypothetical protein EG346_17100 [Chryseobacterium carnipullorum]AZA64682.1 hypothetical protein EG345_08125 [Chryseobacterium carnipullorum]STC95749.1 Uncharacterised protein [Chryseobacterium carnipullorum]